MKKIIWAFLIFLIGFTAFAQEGFIIQKKGLYNYNKPRDLAIKPNGNILFLFTSKQIGSDVFTNYIYEISNVGEVVDSVSYSDTSHKLVEFEHCCFSNDTLYLFGSGSNFGTPQETILFMLKFDASLNLIENFRYSPGLVNFGGAYTGRLKLINDQFYYISAALNQSTDAPFCATISKQGDLIDFGMDLNNPGSLVNLFDFINYENDSGYKVFEGTLGFQGVPEISGLISHYSKDFQRENYFVLPYYMFSFLNYQPVNDTVYFLAGEWLAQNTSENKRAGILKLMNDTTILCEYLHSTVPDSTACPAYRNSMEILPDGNLIFCFTDNINLELFPSLFPTKINLMKLTPDLDIVWHRYIGDGIDSWQAWVMKVNEAEEIIIHGSYNVADISQYLNRDALFIKTTPDGLITGTDDDMPGIRSTETLLYPIPAQKYVMVEFSRAYREATLVISNLSGQQVFKTRLTANKQQVDISTVPAGNYVYRIFNQKGLDESGKLVVSR
jgi:hypothetical protein